MKSPTSITIGCMLFLMPVVAQAYIGPGAGLSALGSLLALLLTVVVAVLGFFWYPLYRFIKRRRGLDEDADPVDTQQQERPQ